jgi:hypothetical protein
VNTVTSKNIKKNYNAIDIKTKSVVKIREWKTLQRHAVVSVYEVLFLTTMIPAEMCPGNCLVYSIPEPHKKTARVAANESFFICEKTYKKYRYCASFRYTTPARAPEKNFFHYFSFRLNVQIIFKVF